MKYEQEYKKKCHVYHDEQCHGYGYHKKCHVVPREECHEVPVKVPVKVPLGKFATRKLIYCRDFQLFFSNIFSLGIQFQYIYPANFVFRGVP